MTRRHHPSLGLAFVLALAAASPAMPAEAMLADPASMPATARRMDFAGRNDFRVEVTESGRCLRSTAHNSASGLYQGLSIAGVDLTRVSWSWRVDALQASADLRQLATEDSGASVFFIFGEPSLFNRDVPTLAYVWSATPVPDGTVFGSARFRSLYYVQLHGPDAVGRWQQEMRNIAADFRRIFGTAPGTLKHIAILNDNDQTGEAATALFCPIRDAR